MQIVSTNKLKVMSSKKSATSTSEVRMKRRNDDRQYDDDDGIEGHTIHSFLDK
jgi:hypothetical protein